LIGEPFARRTQHVMLIRLLARQDLWPLLPVRVTGLLDFRRAGSKAVPPGKLVRGHPLKFMRQVGLVL
jgi:hypothetical protein